MKLVPDKKMDMIIEGVLFSVLFVSDPDCFDGMVDCSFLKHQDYSPYDWG